LRFVKVEITASGPLHAYAVQLERQFQIRSTLVYSPAQVIRSGRFQRLPGPLKKFPRLTEVGVLAKSHGLSHGCADLIAQLSVASCRFLAALGPLVQDPHRSANRQTDKRQRRPQ
jgi:hypothetical protein